MGMKVIVVHDRYLCRPWITKIITLLDPPLQGLKGAHIIISSPKRTYSQSIDAVVCMHLPIIIIIATSNFMSRVIHNAVAMWPWLKVQILIYSLFLCLIRLSSPMSPIIIMEGKTTPQCQVAHVFQVVFPKTNGYFPVHNYVMDQWWVFIQHCTFSQALVIPPILLNILSCFVSVVLSISLPPPPA